MHSNQIKFFEEFTKDASNSAAWKYAASKRPKLVVYDAFSKGWGYEHWSAQEAAEVIGLLLEYSVQEAEKQEAPEEEQFIEIKIDEIEGFENKEEQKQPEKQELEKKKEEMEKEKPNYPKPENPYRRGSKRERIAREILDYWDENYRVNVNTHAIHKNLKPEIGEEPLVFKSVSGDALPGWKQSLRLKAAIIEVNKNLLSLSKKLREERYPPEKEDTKEVPDKSKSISPPKPKPASALYSTPLEWLERVQKQIRPYVQERNIADASMRLSISGAKMYRAMGNDLTAFKAVEHAFALPLPDDAKAALKIEKFNPSTFKVGKISQVAVNQIEAGEHKLMRFVELQHAAGIPTALVGPSGCGKSYLPYQFAKKRGLKFGYVPMTAGASTTWLTGAFTLEGFITRPFVEIYENGGVFLYDEMDAADPNMLLLTNNALANDEFQNPANGKILRKHPDFIPFAAMNTRGTGANRRHVGRERLDAATLDRWAPGMIEMDYDNKLERHIFEAIING